MLILGNNDILFLAKYFVTNFNLQHTTIQLVHPRSSFLELVNRICLGNVDLHGIKVMVLAIGCAEVLNQSVNVEQAIMACREVVNLQDSAIIILVCTPLLWPMDGSMQACKLFRTTAMLKMWCPINTNLQYIWATQDFVTLEGVNLAYIDQQGLTKAGQLQLKKLISGKINCAQLRREYQFLKQGSTVFSGQWVWQSCNCVVIS